ncbi:MAG: hypothetical protein JSV51_05495 [Candidatus Bathyarchaeota archaeon]|nr:MAG: hypothetical protein JSV51_05495 [Candidatus Bathyarchaeota archaeon]
MSESCPLPSGRDCIASTPVQGAMEWESFVKELRRQWGLLWRMRIDDKVRAEGIASIDFELLFIDRGTVIIATKCYKYLDFKEILDQYEAPYEVRIKQEKPLPNVGGWRKFGKKMSSSRKKVNKRRMRTYSENRTKNKKRNLQLKKGGRGWLHFRTG